MIKRFIKLSEKDDSYNSSFKELTSRAIDQPYKNYLNVNRSMKIYNNGLNENKNNNGRIFNRLRNLKIYFFKIMYKYINIK